VKYDLNQLGPTGFEGPHRRPSGSVSSLTSCSCGNVNQPKGEPPPGTSHCTQQPLGELVSSSCRLITLTLAGPACDSANSEGGRSAEQRSCGLNVWTRIQPGIPRALESGVVGASPCETAGSALHPDGEAPPMSQCPAGLLGQVSCPSNKGFTAPVCVIALPARSRPSSIAPVRRSRMGSRDRLRRE
jgi:hypothetical protein